MKLTLDQTKRLYEKSGNWLTEVCDKCGTAIHGGKGDIPPNRFTRFGEKGVWCSRQCRDGIEAAARYEAKLRRPRSEYEQKPKSSGRKPLNSHTMSDAERARKYRAKRHEIQQGGGDILGTLKSTK